MNVSLVLFLLWFAIPLHLFAQANGQTASTPKSPISDNVHQLFLEDQNERGGSLPPPTYGADTTARDTVRRTQVKALLAAGRIQTAQDFHDAAYIFQHGQQADDYMLSHILAVEAVVKGDATSKWISAASLDRYLQAIGRKQVFGTQYITPAPQTQSVQGSENLAPARPRTTQEPFDRTLMPDALRLDFCVPNLEQQTVNLREFDAGRYPTGILPAGCTR